MSRHERPALRLCVGDEMPPELSSPHEPELTALGDMRWHLTRCWSGAETQVSEWLQSLGFETFVPMRIETRNVAKGRGKPERVPVERPAIPGYVPARLPAAGHLLLSLSPGLRPAWRWSPFAWVGGSKDLEPVIMLDSAIERLRQLDELGAFDAPELQRPMIERGDAVFIKLRNDAGQVIYEAVTVVIDIVDGELRVGLRMLGKETTIPIEDVELVEKARGAGGDCDHAER
ncbi:MAG: transcription termination/antitermination NusG family protein [Pseudomonadota bacterium]